MFRVSCFLFLYCVSINSTKPIKKTHMHHWKGRCENCLITFLHLKVDITFLHHKVPLQQIYQNSNFVGIGQTW